MPATPTLTKLKAKKLEKGQKKSLNKTQQLLIGTGESSRHMTSPIGTTNSPATAKEGGSMHPPLDLLRIMYESQNGEWTLTSSDGFSLKFDQAVLTAQVPHFRAIFGHEETDECRNKKIQVPNELEMTKEDLDAFLRFIYYEGTDGMSESFSTTCALVRAGHYYNMPKLVDRAFNLMRSKENSGAAWSSYNIEEMWKLYNHVYLWEEAHPSKTCLIKHLAKAMKRVFKTEKDPDELLTITDGNHVLTSLMIGFAKYKCN